MADSTDSVYVSGLPSTVTVESLAAHFGSIGVLKHDRKTNGPKIWIYKDKATGLPKGDATVSYDDPFSVDGAIEWFNDKPFSGSIIQVSRATPPKAAPEGGYPARGGGGGRGGYGGGGGGGAFGGEDWNCPDCGNVNFAKRFECFRCRKPKPSNAAAAPASSGPSHAPPRPAPGAPAEGDWPCSDCGNMNFARRSECNRCRKPRQEGEGPPASSSYDRPAYGASGGSGAYGRSSAASSFKIGDWPCADCGNLNYARRAECFRCRKPRMGGPASYGGAGGGGVAPPLPPSTTSYDRGSSGSYGQGGGYPPPPPSSASGGGYGYEQRPGGEGSGYYGGESGGSNDRQAHRHSSRRDDRKEHRPY